MSIGAELIVASISAAFSVLLTGIVGYIAWRGEGVLREIERNSSFRRYMAGEDGFERDGGELDAINARFDELRAERQQEHAEVRQQLNEIEEGMGYLSEFVRRLGRAFNASDLDETVREPEEQDPPGFYRGGGSEPEGSDD